MPEHENTRTQTPGRRERDIECERHEKELDGVVKDLDDIRVNVSKNSGRFAAMLWFMGIIGAGLCIGITVAITMLSNIQSTINSSQVTMMQHAEQIRTIRDVELPTIKSDIKEILEKHKWEDQHRSPVK
jgi:hypothetical protein